LTSTGGDPAIAAVRVATYNLRLLRGYPDEAGSRALGSASGERANEAFTRALAALDCDLIAVQEGPASARMRAIADALGMHSAAFASPRRWPAYLASVYPIESSVRFFSDAHDAGADPAFSRAGGAARLRLPSGRPLLAVVVHLHPHDAQLRRVEADLCLDRLDAWRSCDDDDAIVLGDFNSVPPETLHDGLVARGFDNAMLAANGRLARTRLDARQPTACDHIYLSPRLAASLRRCNVVDEGAFGLSDGRDWAYSDHVPVVAEL
jgi:endonuclease/exonuclease/phosphatase family metal-dependent hydrolase